MNVVDVDKFHGNQFLGFFFNYVTSNGTVEP